jgi:hypothetical protein
MVITNPENWSKGNAFANEMKMMSTVYEMLMDIPLHEFISVFDERMHRLRECIDSGEQYLSSDQPTSFDLRPLEKNLSRDKTFHTRYILPISLYFMPDHSQKARNWNTYLLGCLAEDVQLTSLHFAQLPQLLVDNHKKGQTIRVKEMIMISEKDWTYGFQRF